MQYCNQPQDSPFDMKTVPIDTVPLAVTKCKGCSKLCSFLAYVYLLSAAMGEATPGASVQKGGGVAASKQDVYAGECHMTVM